MSILNFNVNELPESQNDFEPIPAGIYDAQISSCEQKPTKDGTGAMLNFGYKIINNTKYNDRMVFTNLNIVNKNEVAQRIALESLRQLMEACEMASVTDTDQFIGKSVTIKVKISPAKDGYDASNDIKSYKKCEQGAAMPTTMGTAPVAKPAAANPWAAKPKQEAAPVVETTAKPPWAK